MEEEFESRIAWSEVFKIIKKRLIIIVAVALVLAIVVGLLTAFVFNAGKDTYTLSFDLKSPTSGYPDGTTFTISSLVYAENLQEVKDAGGEQFASLDIAKLSSGGITIADNSIPTEADQVVNYTSRYTITTQSEYFESFDQANAFMRAVAEKYVSEVNERLATRNYTTWENEFARATTYDAQLNVLTSQYNSVLSNYDSLTSTRAYADFIPATLNDVANTLTLSKLRSEAAGDLLINLDALKAEQTANGYVLESENARYYLESQVATLELERSQNADEITALTAERDKLVGQLVNAGANSNIAATFESFNNRIVTLTQRNIEIAYELNKLYASMGYTSSGEGANTTWTEPEDSTKYKTASPTFIAKIEAIYKQIQVNTSTMEEAVKALYAEFTKVEFAQAQAQVTGGGTSVILVTIAVFVIAAVVVACVFCFVEYPKAKREKEEREAALAAAQAEVKAGPITITEVKDEAAATTTDEDNKEE